jgi:class 3 adenylate cyclase/tetratricopeptide (TPR) repeat protein
MNCPYCSSEAAANAKFCRQCGHRLGNDCPTCGTANPPDSKFCGGCGRALSDTQRATRPQAAPYSESEKPYLLSQGERRHLTIFFSDLCGYTHLMERYDPEDVQLLMTTITELSTRIIAAYHGHVERIIGDEVLALFGLPVTHEDDAVRAVKAAREIHATIAALRPGFLPADTLLKMHTGINTGLVVTARTTPKDGSFDLSGNTVNLASRLADLADPDEILVGSETHRQAFGYFDFTPKPAMPIKGKAHATTVWAVAGEKDRPATAQRNLNLNAVFIGRQGELDHLNAAMERLANGEGSIISIIGEAGTGKSRLLFEFERQFSGRQINWITGYAFAHTQPVPYFPVVHMVRRWLELDGTATEAQMSVGIARRVGALLGPQAREIPIIQGLIGQDVQETIGMSPEEWRKRLKSAMLSLLQAIAAQAPTVFCLEDIHWGDAASFKLLKDLIFNFDVPAIVLCTTRPHASLFTSHEQEYIASIYSELRLNMLSPDETEAMAKSMLATPTLPEELLSLLHNRAEGNPFYLEEILNALVDSGVLTMEAGQWQLKRAFNASDIPSTIHGIIASRMDQLNHQDRRILQEAAVIGRNFLYNILKRISVYSEGVDASLYKLERAGLIRPRALHPEMEFMFKHALIQEVSYGSLLRRERERVHERIAYTIEAVYQDRLSEFDETLALHFQKSTATDKATDYLIRSGTKALRRCALDASDQYFKTAKAMLEQQQLATPDTKKRLLDVANQWAFVFYYKGLNRELLELLEHQRPLVIGLKDPVREGYHWAWYGCALWHRHRFKEAYESLRQAKNLAESSADLNLTGYVATWISWPLTELGRFEEALQNAGRAEKLYLEGSVKDPYIYFNALTAMGYIAWHRGDVQQTARIGRTLLKFGNRHGNVRSLVSGHCCLGWRCLITGNVAAAIDHFREADQISVDPWYSQFPKLSLCYGSISNGRIEEALPYIDPLIRFSDDNGAEFVGEPARFFKGLIEILRGRTSQGLAVMENLLDTWKAGGCRLRTLACGYVMACVYAMLYEKAVQTLTGDAAGHPDELAEKAMRFFDTCVREATDMNAKGVAGKSLLGQAKILSALGRPSAARKTLKQSIAIFTEIKASHHLEAARKLITAR